MKLMSKIGKRLAHFVLVVWLVVTMMFAVLYLVRGNPISLFLDTRLTPELQANLEAIHGYDRSLPEQYGLYLFNLCRGELGVSFIYKEPVWDVLSNRIGKSLWLGGLSYALGSLLCFGFLFGINRSKTRWGRRSWDIARQVCLTVPSFLFGALFIAVLGSKLDLFPIFGSRELFARPTSGWRSFVELLHHSILPAFSLALPMAGQLATHLQEQIRDLKEAGFVLSARGRGVSENRIFVNHILRKLLPGFIQLAGLYLPMVAVGALVIEAMFGWAGMGLILMDSVFSRDYPLLMGGCIWTAFFVIPGYELADYLRERINREQRGAA